MSQQCSDDCNYRPESFGSMQRNLGTQTYEEEPSLVKCTLAMMSGKVLHTEVVNMNDTRLSIGKFFHIAKTALQATECEIRITIGKRALTADKATMKFFKLPEVQDMIGNCNEVKIDVVRIDPRTEKCGCIHGSRTACLQSDHRLPADYFNYPIEDVTWDFEG